MGYEHTTAYLDDTEPDLLKTTDKRLNGKTSSKVERIVRTVNMRAKVSKWSEVDVLNVTKIQLAYHYNGVDA